MEQFVEQFVEKFAEKFVELAVEKSVEASAERGFVRIVQKTRRKAENGARKTQSMATRYGRTG